MPHPPPDACGIFLFTPLLLALGCSTATTFQEHPSMPVHVGDEAPAIDLQLQDGRTVNLRDFRGQQANCQVLFTQDRAWLSLVECNRRYRPVQVISYKPVENAQTL